MELNQNGIWNSSWKNVTWNHHLGPTSLLVPHHDRVHHKTGGLHDSHGGRWFGHIRFHWFIGSPDDGKEKMGSNPTARTTPKKKTTTTENPCSQLIETFYKPGCETSAYCQPMSTVSTDGCFGPSTLSQTSKVWSLGANPLKNISIRQLGPIYPKISQNRFQHKIWHKTSLF